jgi:hypothetical protein
MGVAVKYYLVPALLVLVLCFTVAPASGEKETGTTVIQWGDHLAIKMELDFGINIIDWTIEVEEGPPVDVFFLPAMGYQEFTDDRELEFSYYEPGTELQTKWSVEHFEWETRETTYVVIDNSDICGVPYQMNTTVVSYDISYTVEDPPQTEPGDLSTFWMICVALMIIGVVIGFVIFVKKVNEKRPAPLPPPPRYPSGYQQPGYPPQARQQPPPQYPPGGPPHPPPHYQPGGRPQPPPLHRPGGPPPQSYRPRPPPPPPPRPPPYRESVYHTEDTTYIVEESPSMALDTTDYYAEQLAQKNRDRKRFGG